MEEKEIGIWKIPTIPVKLKLFFKVNKCKRFPFELQSQVEAGGQGISK